MRVNLVLKTKNEFITLLIKNINYLKLINRLIDIYTNLLYENSEVRNENFKF